MTDINKAVEALTVPTAAKRVIDQLNLLRDDYDSWRSLAAASSLPAAWGVASKIASLTTAGGGLAGISILKAISASVISKAIYDIKSADDTLESLIGYQPNHVQAMLRAARDQYDELAVRNYLKIPYDEIAPSDKLALIQKLTDTRVQFILQIQAGKVNDNTDEAKPEPTQPSAGIEA